MMARETERKARRRVVSVVMMWKGEARGRMLVWEAILTNERGMKVKLEMRRGEYSSSILRT